MLLLITLSLVQYIDATTHFLFGESVGELSDSEHSAAVSRYFNEALQGSALRIALGPLRFLAKPRRWMDACRSAQAFADGYVEKALKTKEDRTTKELGLNEERKTILLHDLVERIEDRRELRNAVL